MNTDLLLFRGKDGERLSADCSSSVAGFRMFLSELKRVHCTICLYTSCFGCGDERLLSLNFRAVYVVKTKCHPPSHAQPLILRRAPKHHAVQFLRWSDLGKATVHV